MAEALALTASILAVLQVTESVLRVCYDYGAALKGSSWELTKTKDELQGFRTVVQAVEPLMREADLSDPTTPNGRLPTLKTLCEPGGVLQSCLGDLQYLEKKLKGPAWTDELGPRRKALLQSFKWPFQEEDTRKILERIGRFGDTLATALEVDHTRLTLAIHRLGRNTYESVHSIKDVVEETRDKATLKKLEREREKLKKEIEDWLSAPDPSINHRRAQKSHQEGTGSWFLESDEYARWEQQRIVTWLYGIPGCGKTVLSSTIIETVRQKYLPVDDTAVLYFYFDFNDAQKQKPEYMARSLLSQLMGQSAKAFEKVRCLYASCSDGRSRPELTALCKTLGEVVQELNETFILLDALDECGEMEELFEIISHIRSIGLQKSHMLLTSRRLPDIEEALRPLLSGTDGVRVGGDPVNSDILIYINQRLQDDPKLKRWRKLPEVQEEIRTTLAEKADGMFRWTVCQLDALRNCMGRAALDKALNNLPKSLDETYGRILCSIDEESADYAFTMLQWLTYSRRPLSVEELAEVLAIRTDTDGGPWFDPAARFPEPSEVLSILSSLVTTEDPQWPGDSEWPGDFQWPGYSPIVRFAHFSVQEYLTSDRIKSHAVRRYAIRESIATQHIAHATCAYLIHLGEFDTSWDPVQLIMYWPLFNFANQNWAEQLQMLDKEAIPNKLVMKLLLTFHGLEEKSTIRQKMACYHHSVGGVSHEVYMPVDHLLGWAAWLGLPELVESLLLAGENINSRSKLCGNALLAAISGNADEDLLHLLLTKGSEVNAKSSTESRAFPNSSALHIAIVRKNVPATRMLLEYGADANAQGSNGPALHMACRARNLETVALLLRHGADVNIEVVEHVFGQTSTTPLTAVLHGPGDVLRGRGDSSEINIAPVIQLLLDHGADVNLENRAGTNLAGMCWFQDWCTALQIAIFYDHSTAVDLLLHAGADVNLETSRGTALTAAIDTSNEVYVRKLIDSGANVNAIDPSGATGLSAACGRGLYEIARLLLQNGANMYLGKSISCATLHAACCCGDFRVVKLLLDQGFDVNLVDGFFGTALQAAAAASFTKKGTLSERLRIIEMLLDSGAGIDSEAGNYNTALQAAACIKTIARHHMCHQEEHEQYQVVKLLVCRGANLNLRGGEYVTAVRAAACSNWIEVVKLLLEKGAMVTADDIECVNCKTDGILRSWEEWDAPEERGLREESAAKCLILLEEAYSSQSTRVRRRSI
ncbi:MAG: hypothetical protein Q9168_006366 [Polycauliona sp. 1 TL-2023]